MENQAYQVCRDPSVPKEAREKPEQQGSAFPDNKVKRGQGDSQDLLDLLVKEDYLVLLALQGIGATEVILGFLDHRGRLAPE